jgi:DNA-binding response OmpR family regulator
MVQQKILFAEDEAILGKLVKEALDREPDFKVQWAKTGQEALQYFQDTPPDICLFDVMLPKIDGFTLAKKIRLINADVPIFFLTARSDTADVLKGFSSGGNDYLKKPFSIEELVIRLRELLRRNNKATPLQENYEFGTYWFSPATQTLRNEKEVFQLSGKEAELLKLLVLHKNNLLERKTVLMQLWGDDNFFNARNMDVYIGRLRKYLIHDTHLSIVNIRGYGYKLIEQVS